MNESKALRVLADRLDEMESLKAFPTDVSDPGEVTVSWTEGKDHEGYAALSSAISALVGQHWNALRSQVLKAKEGEVQAARNTWNGFVGGSTAAAEPAQPAQTSPAPASEVGVRRFG